MEAADMSKWPRLGAVAEVTLLGAVLLAPMNSWHQTRLLKSRRLKFTSDKAAH